MAKSGLEMVFWDLQGKLENRCLRELLSGERNRVNVWCFGGHPIKFRGFGENRGRLPEPGIP